MAWNEGFAHFYAAKLFNNPAHSDCVVGYYKEVLLPRILHSGGVAHFAYPPPVVISCYDAERWMKSQCSTLEASGVEWDWMTALWNIHTQERYGNDRISMGEYYAVKRLACTGNTVDKCQGSHPLNCAKWFTASDAYFGNNTPKSRNVYDTTVAHGLQNW